MKAALITCLAASLASYVSAETLLRSTDLIHDRTDGPARQGAGGNQAAHGTAYLSDEDPTAVVEVKATATKSKNIVSAGKLTDADLKDIMGDKYGRSFKVVLQDGNGKEVGFLSGTFDNGQPKLNPLNFIPSTNKVYETTIIVNDTDTKVMDQQLNNIDYHDALSMVDYHYGDYYIHFTNEARKLNGWINGTIQPTNYGYRWGYKYV
ncbi:hypothetical protein VHEMI09289 [[Torrubiella] hemipterigena]|uniref:Uncharacterized protein n=1 Tax=[Torrubiella] hemipterigena TaxID=1531966 RepID=A0A0A1TQ43_9HYPO|nr:hypothetical protein VHEMI09289 [[Torrubiella] hemipterigena]